MSSTVAQLRYSPLLPNHTNRATPNPIRSNHNLSFSFSSSPLANHHISISPTNANSLLPCHSTAGDGGGAAGGDGWSGGGRGGGGGNDDSSNHDLLGPIGAFLNGWRSRVAADPEFPFKVLMEEVVGVSANVIGDMASRPNFGLNELDFVFSTLVVGSIVNFTLMYLLAPTLGSSAASLPSIFANGPTSHMFEPGPFTLANRLGTFVFKGAQFAAVGFMAGLVGTAISNGLVKMRTKMDPNFKTPNKPPPTILNALTWAAHMGLSANFRYQSLNGVEFLLAKGLPSFAFKTSVVVLRVANNLIGGMTFVMLAKLTGSQSSGGDEGGKEVVAVGSEEEPSVAAAAEEDKLIQQENSESNDSVPKY